MPNRPAYIVAAKTTPWNDSPGQRPRPEYDLYLERNNNVFVDYASLATTKSRTAKEFVRRRKSHIALAAAVAAESNKYPAFITSGEDVGLPLAFFLRMRGKTPPISIITHGSYFRSPKFAALMSVFRKFRNVQFLTLSNALRQAMLERFRVPSERVHNTSYGVDTGFFSPIQTSETLDIVASAGTANRDYRTLVNAAADLPVEVKIAADSAWFPSAVDISKDTLPKNVEARSYGNYVGLRDLYSKARFLVVPLYPARHACGYAVIVEAMAMGKPVITTRTEAQCDFIVDGENGYTLEPGDVEAMRNKIQELLANPERVAEMGTNARKRIETHYSLEAYCSRIEDAIRKQLGKA